MRPERRLPLLLVTLLVAGCAAEPPKPAPRPAPAPPPVAPRPAPPPVAQPAPAQPSVEWQDLPLTPGNWSYDEQRMQASFGAGETSFTLRCDRQNRQVLLLRPGVTTGNMMRVQTSEATRGIALSVTTDPVGDALRQPERAGPVARCHRVQPRTVQRRGARAADAGDACMAGAGAGGRGMSGMIRRDAATRRERKNLSENFLNTRLDR